MFSLIPLSLSQKKKKKRRHRRSDRNGTRSPEQVGIGHFLDQCEPLYEFDGEREEGRGERDRWREIYIDRERER